MNLQSLEDRLLILKQAGDYQGIRDLLPIINQARRNARELEQAKAIELNKQGFYANGTPMSPHDKLVMAIFGN